MDKYAILSEIRRIAEENGGKPLGKNNFHKTTGIKSSDWEGKYWVRWSNAVQKVGFQPNKTQAAYGDEFLLKKTHRIFEGN